MVRMSFCVGGRENKAFVWREERRDDTILPCSVLPVPSHLLVLPAQVMGQEGRELVAETLWLAFLDHLWQQGNNGIPVSMLMDVRNVSRTGAYFSLPDICHCPFLRAAMRMMEDEDKEERKAKAAEDSTEKKEEDKKEEKKASDDNDNNDDDDDDEGGGVNPFLPGPVAMLQQMIRHKQERERQEQMQQEREGEQRTVVIG